jgi:uncharacterized coiled-coil DUF342 family protein
MSSANKALFLVLVVASLGLWGCTQTPGGSSGSARIRDLEARNAKLEEDYQAAIQARDQTRKKLAAVEEKSNQQAKQLVQLQSITQERDELKQLVNQRSTERDTIQNQFEQFRKGIRNLLGQAEASVATPPATPVTSAVSDRQGSSS